MRDGRIPQILAARQNRSKPTPLKASCGLHCEEYDADRTKQVKDFGYHVIRFWNEMVINELDNVLDQIMYAAFDRSKSLTPVPSPDAIRRESSSLPMKLGDEVVVMSRAQNR